MNGRWQYFGIAAAILAAAAVGSACSPSTRYRVLSTIFDDVPPPGFEPPPRRPVRTPRVLAWKVAQLAESEEEEVPSLEPVVEIPPILAARTWPDAFEQLPRDFLGGPDWVEAVEHGLIEPRASLDPEQRDPLPFPLEIVIDEGENFEVLFPHFEHTLWLDCPNCHPDIFKMKRGANDFEMADVFAGQYCGRCHGKVAFAPEAGCVRCHTRLDPEYSELSQTEMAEAARSPVASSAQLLAQGKAAYQRYCVMCHGDDGDGQGRAAVFLDPKPRDFRQGTFKFRTTAGGMLPTDADIFRTITAGLPGTSMPSWAVLPYRERWALVHYVKTFSDRFAEEDPDEPLEIPQPPEATAQMLEEGAQLYVDAGCSACHGEEGWGDGPSAATLEDDWGYPIRPFAFAGPKPMKSGPDVTDIYRTMMTGLNGTPMPSFGDVLDPELAWPIVHHVAAIRERASQAALAAETSARSGIHYPGPASIAAELTSARAAPVPATPDLLELGKLVYTQQCAVCHGEQGDGAGPAAAEIYPKPRDFRQGKYKFRSTEGGMLPTDADIFRTITVGLAGTSMPGWAVLPAEERWALVHYLKTFSERFANEDHGEPLHVPEPVARTAELLEEGAQLYIDAGCSACHGTEGWGDGPSAAGLEDDWGYPIQPFPFASGKPLKSGPGLEDIYRTIMTGLNGTPMPSFGDVLDSELAWPIVHYVDSLMTRSRVALQREH